MNPVRVAPRSVYVHVPFCRHRCGYCDFPLVAGRDDLIDAFFRALQIELGRVEVPLVIDTLYLGGGTPSHLGSDRLRMLFDHLTGRMELSDGAEITIEANPLDVSEDFVRAVMGCGVTRVSVGAQSLQAKTLAALDRDHQPAHVVTAVDRLRHAGCVVSIDLMIAAPGQTFSAVEHDLAALAAIGCEHVSVYCLTWEPGTAFARLRRQGRLEPVAESEERAMYLAAIDRLESAGYEHYEVSNFARTGFRCRHNETYWACRSWEAFGPGAARFDGRVRHTNHRSTLTWMKRLLDGIDPTAESDAMNDEEAARERLVLALRRREGVDRDCFSAESGFTPEQLAGDAILRWVGAGLAIDDGRSLRLTREGLLVSDSLWGEVLSP